MKFFTATLLLTSSLSFAGGWTSSAIPTRIDIVKGNGFMVSGDFGNPGHCENENKFYVTRGHPDYHALYSAVLNALLYHKKILAFIDFCSPINAYTKESTTWNLVGGDGSLSLIDPASQDLTTDLLEFRELNAQ